MKELGATLSFLLLVAGCECGEGSSDVYGEARWRPADDLRVVDAEAWVEFGGVRFGTTQTRVASIENVGRAPLSVTADALSSPFSSPAIDSSVPLAGAQPIVITFSPVDDGSGVGATESTASLPIAVAGEAAPRKLTLHVSGTGFGARCALPETVDFGVVVLGETERRTFQVQNAMPEAVEAFFHPLTDGFSWPASVRIESNSESTVEVSFSPSEPRTYAVDALARASADCPYTTVHLVGRGVSTLLAWEPTTIDCGWVPVGASVERTVRFHNYGLATVSVRDFTTQGAASTDDVALTVAAGRDAEHIVRCVSAVLGAQSAQLHFTTSLEQPAAGVVPITFRGGGPQIDLQPSPLNFGRAAVDVPTTRRFFVRNVGAGAALVLTADGGIPLVGVVADSSISPSDVRLAPGAYDGGIAVGAMIPVEVTFVPREERQYEFTLALESNDPLRPRAELPVRVAGVALPPCQLSVQPTVLEFGVLRESEVATRSVRLTNTASDECIVTSIDVADSTGTFSLVGGSREVESLMPGASLELSLRAQGDGPLGTRAAQLKFDVSDPALPHRTVLLRSFGASECFLVAPTPVDFGPTPIGCGSIRAVSVYNTCTPPISVAGASVVSGAAFSIDAGTVASVAAAQAAVFEVGFAPTTVGVFEGELALGIDGQTRLHPVRGEGVLLQQTTESFVQPAIARTDVLFAVGQASGLPELGLPPDYEFTLNASFRERMTASVDALLDAGVDLHVGVIAENWDREIWELTAPAPLLPPPPWLDGELVPAFDGGPSFVTGATPDASMAVSESMRRVSAWPKFATNDISGACFEMLRRALTPPRSDGTNAGFRRPDVHLSLICQSTFGDYSTVVRVNGESEPLVPWVLPLSTDYYWGALSAAAGASFDLSVIGHVPGPPDCSSPSLDPGGRLAELVQRSGGVIIDACEPDGASALAELTGHLQSFNRRFVLRGIPDTAAPMFVTVNGEPLTIGEWQLVANSIIEFDVAPAPNAAITVSYVPRCGP